MLDIERLRTIRWGMVLVLLIAALLRLAALPDLPLGLHYDEAANLILTRQIVDEGYRPLFIRAYTGKEPLFFYLVAPWVWMTGDALWGLRLGAAMLGILTVAATFAAVRALLPGRSGRLWIALFAAGWLAIAFPHVLLSRYGFRAISQPLLQALTVALLWRGLRVGKWPWLMASGASLGLIAYTYLAARLFPIPLALALLWLLWRMPKQARATALKRVGIVLVVALVSFVPLGSYFLRHPDAFFTRITQVAAPSWPAALDGIWLCLKALVWPGGGDGYIRFNAPGMPVIRPVAAGLALLGVGAMFAVRRVSVLESAGRFMAVTASLVMVLPSALATGEITPSNLRMVGIFPFVALFPAWGLYVLLRLLQRPGLRLWVVAGFLAGGAALTASQYTGWALSGTLFEATDGEMVLAAAALDAAVEEETTIYVASEHYRHPTVAALAIHYADAKWLTGGASLVLPPAGDAVYLIPDGQLPPTPWPDAVMQSGRVVHIQGPGGETGITEIHLLADTIDKLRSEWLAQGPSADFAHVVEVYGATPTDECRAGDPCTVTVLWEPQATYGSLQPVLRLLDLETGEWARTMAFHYPPEQWTLGDLVLDQLVLTPPIETPPGGAYQIGVGFYDSQKEIALPRLIDERFAGFEVVFPEEQPGLTIAPAAKPPTPAQMEDVCSSIPRATVGISDAVELLGAQVMSDSPLLPGSALTIRLCWHVLTDAPELDGINLTLSSPESSLVLFSGEPTPGYGFEHWRRGDVFEARYRVRIPRAFPSGDYVLTLYLDDAVAVSLDEVKVQTLARSFTVPHVSHQLNADFVATEGNRIRLVGYDFSVSDAGNRLEVTLYWQAESEMVEDYVVFVHLRDTETDMLVAQVDEMPRNSLIADLDSYPTSLWTQGEVIADTHVLALPEGLLSGETSLYVGLYLPADGTHLTVADELRLELPAFSDISLK